MLTLCKFVLFDTGPVTYIITSLKTLRRLSLFSFGVVSGCLAAALSNVILLRVRTVRVDGLRVRRCHVMFSRVQALLLLLRSSSVLLLLVH